MNQHSSIDKLIKLNEEGVIPRENETESSFFKRVEKDKPSFNYSYCKKNLSFYEMACVIVDEAKVEVFLHPIFEKKENFLGISKQEIIDHEKVHFIRQGFKQGRFEETIAYLTSKCRFRKILGGFFKNYIEAKIFVFTTFAVPVFAFLEFGFYWFFASYLSYIFYLVYRTVRDYKIVSSVLSKLQKISQRPLDILVRLSDQEILELKNKKEEETPHFFETKQNDFRFQQILFLIKR